MILHVLITMVAGWLQRHQQQVISYLIEEHCAHGCLHAAMGTAVDRSV